MVSSTGIPELLVILVIVLIVFGMRRLPELGRSLGTAIAEFRRAKNGLPSTLERKGRAGEPRASQEAAASVARPSQQAQSSGEEIVGLFG